MPFNEFLNLIKVLKQLYGRDYAQRVFEKNYRLFYNLNELGTELDFEDLPLQSTSY